jgi:hypothetical protein
MQNQPGARGQTRRTRTPAGVKEHGVVAHVRAEHADNGALLAREAEPALERGRGERGGRLADARLELIPRAPGAVVRVDLKDVIRRVRRAALERERGYVCRRERGERGEARVQGHHLATQTMGAGESVGRTVGRRLQRAVASYDARVLGRVSEGSMTAKHARHAHDSRVETDDCRPFAQTMSLRGRNWLYWILHQR